jgi:alpha-1,3-glucosyltransferase
VGMVLSRLQGGYILGFVALQAYTSLGHQWVLGGSLPFLPLMLTSLYCSAGVCWVWSNMAVGYCRQALATAC